jgi:hypothetical protein
VCHYAKLTVPVPAVIVVILKSPIVDVLSVKELEISVIVNAEGYLRITIPEPPAPAVPEPFEPPPPPLPVLAVPDCAVPPP